MRFVALEQAQHHLCAPRPATADASVDMRHDSLDVTAVWERIVLPYDRVALRTPHGCFLSCQVDDGRPRMALSEELGPREAFVEVLWPDGAVSLRTCEMTFVAVADAGPGRTAVTCNSVETDAPARFRYVDPPEELRARAEEIVERQPQVPDMPRQFAHAAEELRDTANGNGQG
jgi:hypothetical protein